eukprot:Awhi_evm1s4013
MVDLIARKKATINKMMNDFRQCYKEHDEKDFCWNTGMMKSIPTHRKRLLCFQLWDLELYPSTNIFHFPMYDFASMDSTLRPINFVRYGSETLYHHGKEQNYFGKDEKLTHTEAFCSTCGKGFPDQCFDSVGPLKETLELGLKEALAEDRLTENPKILKIPDLQICVLHKRNSKDHQLVVVVVTLVVPVRISVLMVTMEGLGASAKSGSESSSTTRIIIIKIP